MKRHHRITHKEKALEDTLNLGDSLHVRVIAKSGLVVGTVSQIRIHPTKMCIEGIVVSRGFFKRPLYIGSSYIKRLSHESFLLSVDPSVLLRGKKVRDVHGRNVGKVWDVVRKEHSNEIQDLIVSSLLQKNLVIPLTQVKYLGESILLKPTYHVKKKYFWQKS